MTQRHADWKQLLAVVCLAALGGAFSIASAAESAFVGSQSCNSVSCHGRAEPRRVAGGISGASLQEFALYSRHDPHAGAAKTLASAEFQAIVSRLSERKGGPSSAEVYRQCAQCHDPEGIAAADQSAERLIPVEPSHGISSRGISCESCHGGGKNWLATHYERDVSRSSLVAAGMRDTKDLKVRAELCASCHVGGAERNVHHDLLAAGHPPLRFELAAYHRKLTSHDEGGKQSHWNDALERIGTKDFEVKLWEAGRIASAKATLTLLESRAHRAALEIKESDSTSISWPEFAEYDCFSCHQKLRPADRESSRLPTSIPEWGKWNLAFVSASAEAKDAKELSPLRAEMKKAFTAEPAAVEVQAANAQRTLIPSLFQVTASSGELLELLELPSAARNSWETICQRYLAHRALQKSIGDEFKKLELAGQVSVAERTEFDGERRRVDRDLAAIAKTLSFSSSKSEWPSVFMDADGLVKVESELAATAGRLRKLQQSLGPSR